MKLTACNISKNISKEMESLPSKAWFSSFSKAAYTATAVTAAALKTLISHDTQWGQRSLLSTADDTTSDHSSLSLSDTGPESHFNPEASQTPQSPLVVKNTEDLQTITAIREEIKQMNREVDIQKRHLEKRTEHLKSLNGIGTVYTDDRKPTPFQRQRASREMKRKLRELRERERQIDLFQGNLINCFTNMDQFRKNNYNDDMKETLNLCRWFLLNMQGTETFRIVMNGAENNTKLSDEEYFNQNSDTTHSHISRKLNELKNSNLMVKEIYRLWELTGRAHKDKIYEIQTPNPDYSRINGLYYHDESVASSDTYLQLCLRGVEPCYLEVQDRTWDLPEQYQAVKQQFGIKNYADVTIKNIYIGDKNYENDEPFAGETKVGKWNLFEKGKLRNTMGELNKRVKITVKELDYDSSSNDLPEPSS